MSQHTTLHTHAPDPLNATWDDYYLKTEDKTGTITFYTAGEALCRWYTNNEFAVDDGSFLGPGIYESDSHGMVEDDGTNIINLYVILPTNFLSEDVINDYVEQINERYEDLPVLEADFEPVKWKQAADEKGQYLTPSPSIID